MEINQAIKELDKIEANLSKLFRIESELTALIPKEISFYSDSDTKYDDLSRRFNDIWMEMPKIDSWKPVIQIISLNEIAQIRMEATELGILEIEIDLARRISEPKKILQEYRYKMQKNRLLFIRSHLKKLKEIIDDELSKIEYQQMSVNETSTLIAEDKIKPLSDAFKAIDVLLGSLKRPSRWSDMSRHIYYHNNIDLDDINRLDWPEISEELDALIYSEYDPLPVTLYDINEAIEDETEETIITKLKWENLTDELFERLVFNIFMKSPGYENTKWLTATRAPDRGRDLSTTRLIQDSLVGVINQRVIIQCKHWLKKSVNIDEISSIKAQMKLWEPPRVDICIITTTGRFTTDAIDYIEKANQEDSRLRIEMWPESHLEVILSKYPDLIAEYKLR